MVTTRRSIAGGKTFSVNGGTTDDAITYETTGTLSNQGTTEAALSDTTSTDLDTTTSTLTRERSLVATAVDIDATISQLTRLRKFVSTAADVDASDTQLTRERSLVGTASDVDSATALFLIPVDADRALATVKEILERTASTKWSNETPTVLNYWDRTQQERGQGAGQPAEIYLWEPAGKDIERFSLDDTSTQDTASVEALVYSLDEQEVIDYAEDARGILELYFDTNKSPTAWQTIEVTSVNDLREQTQQRSTDQYVVSLEIELEKINDV